MKLRRLLRWIPLIHFWNKRRGVQIGLVDQPRAYVKECTVCGKLSVKFEYAPENYSKARRKVVEEYKDWREDYAYN